MTKPIDTNTYIGIYYIFLLLINWLTFLWFTIMFTIFLNSILDYIYKKKFKIYSAGEPIKLNKEVYKIKVTSLGLFIAFLYYMAPY